MIELCYVIYFVFSYQYCLGNMENLVVKKFSRDWRQILEFVEITNKIINAKWELNELLGGFYVGEAPEEFP